MGLRPKFGTRVGTEQSWDQVKLTWSIFTLLSSLLKEPPFLGHQGDPTQCLGHDVDFSRGLVTLASLKIPPPRWWALVSSCVRVGWSKASVLLRVSGLGAHALSTITSKELESEMGLSGEWGTESKEERTLRFLLIYRAANRGLYFK